ncbi:MAG: hypothetical protein PHY34_04100 [Patescibacteria group bacterium]|nr:hypothetical protein [Patescibacteria group bacterium]MDD5715491.1 hypothetical protein [Patescibacteria group bacterium]
MAPKMPENQNKNLLQRLFSDPYFEADEARRKERTRTVVVSIVVGTAVVAFGIWYIGMQISNPFEYEVLLSNQDLATLNTSQTSVERLESLRAKDTDSDGLNDYDELYTFSTSPYIADSDSDGTSDKDELAAGQDPNCPAGDTCGRETATNSNANTNVSGLVNDITAGTNSEPLTQVDLSNLSADELRSIMRDAGASEEFLSSISDEDLQAAYLDIVGGQTGTNTAVNANSATNAQATTNSVTTDSITYERLQSLTPDEIRELLAESGIAAETLNQIDDETLRAIYLESLETNLGTSE